MKQILLIAFIVLSCIAKAQSDQREIFEELWSVFNDRYAGFEPRNINWEELQAPYLTRAGKLTNDNELFTICCDLIQELNDAHVSLRDDENSLYCNGYGSRDSTTVLKAFGDKDNFFQVSNKMLIANGFSPLVAMDETVYHASNKEIAYIRIDQMMDNYQAFLKALRSVEKSRGLILDIRLNRGGNDFVLHKIAGHFVKDEQLSHWKITRKSGTNKYTEPKYWNLKPSSRLTYSKPVIVLISDYTVSAAEVFAMIMGSLPQAILIGQNTNGSMSHLASYSLSNGWQVSLSNKRTFSMDSINYEGSGVPPDIYLSYKSREKDEVLITAIELLKR